MALFTDGSDGAVLDLGSFGRLTLSGVEAADLSIGDFFVTAPNSQSGGPGPDTFVNGPGDEQFDGGTGRDTVLYCE